MITFRGLISGGINVQLLKVENVHTYYGDSYILQGVSLYLNRGEIVTLLGRNGAGKSTTLKSVIGLTPPREGKILYDGEEINGWSAYKIARLGIGYVPEDRRVFGTLTVAENLNIGLSERKRGWSLDKIYDLFPKLKSREHHWGTQLSGGEQQMLTIARCLLCNPALILLDEPSEGLAPIVVAEIANTIQKLRSEKMTVLLVEQNVLMTLRLADRHYIIDSGRIIYEGSNEDLRGNQEIQKNYLTL